MIELRKPVVIIGLGQTGYACLRFLNEKGIASTVVDSREQPPLLQKATENFADVECICGSLEVDAVYSAGTLIVSPGVSIHQPAIKKAAKNGAEIIGDIELFTGAAKAPILAITGSNGKSTVTDLLGKLLKSLGKHVEVGGNIGTPVLELSFEDRVDFYVLELSSFQLETTHSLKARVATVLNISPDHLDRYQDMDDYLNSKLGIFSENTKAVVPFEQNWNLPKVKSIITFSLDKDATFSIVEKNQKQWVSVAGQPWMAISDLQIFGQHNRLNVLAALAMTQTAGIKLFGEHQQSLINTLKNYKGLPHRCEIICKQLDVLWVNDSKATNVASTVAAIESFAELFSGKIVLIAGGDAKDADLSMLKNSLILHIFALITFGKDGARISSLASSEILKEEVDNLQQAVEKAAEIVPANGVVLLSPACSSLDMFSSYIERGESFVKAVEGLAA